METITPFLRLGTSSWSCQDWVGTFYRTGTPPADFISAYAKKFNTVEIDSTFYAIPRASTVEGWRDRTPEGFLFSAKAPQRITHEKFLVDCVPDLTQFLKVMSILGGRLGPVLLQFPYYAKKSGVGGEEFLKRLGNFLPSLSKDFQWVVEVRNKAWLGKALLEMLGEHGIPLALIDHPWMYRPDELFGKQGIETGPFAYIRWLGDRYGIEKKATAWNETIVDRRSDLEHWVTHMVRLLQRRVPVFGYANNHYGGYALGTLDLLYELLGKHAPDGR